MAEDRVAAEPHYSEDFTEGDGWWHGKCVCGRIVGVFPTAEDAADALMQHAYEQGILDERNGRVPR